ncbi:hypothetical protein JCM10908_005165 [Rhodotorula pacifica]|uniref:uncharacterized protein n=1 Tax=Rhodotorula pacifica TaxID=1495444 RepID=UPI003179228B
MPSLRHCSSDREMSSVSESSSEQGEGLRDPSRPTFSLPRTSRTTSSISGTEQQQQQKKHSSRFGPKKSTRERVERSTGHASSPYEQLRPPSPTLPAHSNCWSRVPQDRFDVEEGEDAGGGAQAGRWRERRVKVGGGKTASVHTVLIIGGLVLLVAVIVVLAIMFRKRDSS